MKNKKILATLVFLIVILAGWAAATGIFSSQGEGSYEIQTIRNRTVTIYGLGLYRHMSADVAIQGIAQDYVTLFLALPLLLFAFFWARKGTLRSLLFLAGILSYIFLTYLFYMNMAMFNELFLVYVSLAGMTFFALALTLLSIGTEKLSSNFQEKTPVKFIGGFLIFNATCIALLWLSIIVPPLLDGSIVPVSVEHYTTLTVQAFDLALFLPLSFLSGLLLRKKSNFGFLMAPVYLVFLSLLMTALIAKICAMAMAEVNVIPAIFVIPCIAFAAIGCAFVLFKNIRNL